MSYNPFPKFSGQQYLVYQYEISSDYSSPLQPNKTEVKWE
ncbi:hypothetical protein GCHA_1174 [Paraglaciecola chathamensis S18K6]|uniref:Uncharacterized protein n=1 Tax=Paraglaciecola chathamensis S18K6 TaxID=1127672 RepID=A0AAV3UVI1_9ALTE|nr:hypothetical protein GCHA_1174 [Paraglaciecola chathamensis S18K6]